MKRGQFSSHSSLNASPGTWLVGLLILGYILANAGYSFLAFLAVILGFLLFVGGSFSRPGAAPSGHQQNYGSMGGGGIPPVIQFQPNWAGPTSGEERVGKNLAHIANFMGSTVGWLTGGKPEI